MVSRRSFLPLIAGLLVLAALVLISPPERTNAGLVFGVIETVNSANDMDDGTCNAAHCSLREAINAVNGAGPSSAIRFDLANCPPACTISPQSPLPSTTNDGLTINGASEPDFDGEPLIVVDGSAQGGFTSVLRTNGTSTTIHSLQIRNGPASGVTAGAGALVIADSVVAGNAGIGISATDGGTLSVTISGSSVMENSGNGIRATGDSVVIEDSVVSGNTADGIFTAFIGIGSVTIGGSSVTENGGEGIQAAGDSVVVEGSVVSGNGADGISTAGGTVAVMISGSSVIENGGDGIATGGDSVVVEDSVVSGNTGDGIDTAFAGTGSVTISGSSVMENGDDGIDVGGDNLMVFDNVVSANGGEGITSAGGGGIHQFLSNEVTSNGGTGVRAATGTGMVAGNTITGNGGGVATASNGPAPGLALAGTQGKTVTGNQITGNAGHGMEILGSGNTVGGTSQQDANVVTGNGGAGVYVGPAADEQGNSILGNSIHNNGGLGIDIEPVGVNDNDPLDADAGANGLQNHPLLATATPGSVTVMGTLNSVPSTEFRIEVFHNASCDPSGFGEGQTLLGAFQVTPDASGTAEIEVLLDAAPATGFITATATNSTTGDTSEFSNCIPIMAPATPTPTPSASPSPTPTPTTTPTPSASPTGGPSVTFRGREIPWGDHDCSDAADPIDALLTLRFDAGLGRPDDPACPFIGHPVNVHDASTHTWGDVDCSEELQGAINPIDALKILRFDAGLEVDQPSGCPELGDLRVVQWA